MRDLLGVQVGLSDHTMGVGVGVASVVLGATVIEKHFTLRRADGGVDSVFSMEPHELKMLVEETHKAFLSLGRITYGPQEAEKNSLIFRRSIYITKDIKKGEKLTSDNIRCIRPGLGLAPKHFDQVLGAKVNCDLKMGTALKWDHLINS
jgi:N-acetylneuraminate synthase